MLSSGELKPDQVIDSTVPGDKFTLLEAAVERGWTDIAIYVIEKGGMVKGFSSPASLLRWACGGSHTGIVEALLKAGANPNFSNRVVEDSSGESALMISAECGDLKTMEVLLKAGADPRKVTS